MDLPDSWLDKAAASQGKHHTAGSYEISVEALNERKQCRHEDDIDDPARTYGALEGHGGHEFFASQLVPWRDECDRGDDDCVEENADQDGHPDGFEKALAAKLGCGFFSSFADGFESRHE